MIRDEEVHLQTITYSASEKTACTLLSGNITRPILSSHTPLVLINPNASALLPQRRWMPDKYVALIQRILTIIPTCSS